MISKKYNSIDLVKLFMAICVVAIHTEPLYYCLNGLVKNIFGAVVGVAVPFFFIASGFLMANKFDNEFSSENNCAVVKRTLIHIVKLYVIWTAIYLPITIYHFCQEGVSFLHQVIAFILGFVFVGEQYNSWPLWYLLSTIYALILILLLMKLKVNRNVLPVICLVFLFANAFVSWFVSYDGTLPTMLVFIQKVLSNTIKTGRIFTGAFYIPLGIYLQKKKLPLSISILMLGIGLALNVIVESSTISILLTALTSIGLFEVILMLKLKDNSIYPLLRKMSTVVYFIHMYIWTAYYMIVYHTKTYGIDSFLVTMLIALLISFVYCKIMTLFKNKKHTC